MLVLPPVLPPEELEDELELDDELDEEDELDEDEEPPEPPVLDVVVEVMPPLEVEVEPPLVEVEPPLVDVEPPLVEVEVEPPELVELMTTLPPLEPPPKKPPKKPPPKPPNDGPPPITIGIALPPESICIGGGGGI